MEKVLWDMLQADRFVNGFIIKPNDSIDRKLEIARTYAQVFSIHGITQEDFLKSYKFYLSRPDITKVMFDSISIRAERRKADVYKLQMKKDSLSVPGRDSLRSNVKDSLLRKRRLQLKKK